MSTTTLDDLKIAWQTLDRRLERQHALALQQFKETKLARLRGGFRPLVTAQSIQVIFGVMLALYSGGFWFRHLGTPHLMVYGLLLHAFALMMIVFASRDLVLINSIDYDAPVLAIQKQIAVLRAWRLKAGVWFAVTGCFMWTPFILVMFYVMGVDVWVRNPRVVGWYVASSFLCLGLSYALLVWSRRPGQTRLAKHLQDSSAGRSVTRAQAMLDEIERFERE